MLNRVTWRAWAVPAALFGAYIILGLTWTPHGSALEWIFKTGTLGATFTPVMLVGIYSAAAKWWQNDVGLALVQLALGISIIAGAARLVGVAGRGSITGGMVAWLEIAGPVLVTLAILRLCFVFLRDPPGRERQRRAGRLRRGKLARPAVFGGFDGCASLLGVVVYLIASHPSLIFPAALSGAIGSALSAWAAASGSATATPVSAPPCVMGGATFLGALFPPLPFALATGPAAVAESAVICC